MNPKLNNSIIEYDRVTSGESMENRNTIPQQNEMVTIRMTDKAVEEVRRIKAENNIPDTLGLRIGIKGGGCSGFSYFLGFDEQRSDDDTVTSINGLSVVVDAQSTPFLQGAELDFLSNEDGKGFTINNPNVHNGCNCGHDSCDEKGGG